MGIAPRSKLHLDAIRLVRAWREVKPPIIDDARVLFNFDTHYDFGMGQHGAPLQSILMYHDSWAVTSETIKCRTIISLPYYVQMCPLSGPD